MKQVYQVFGSMSGSCDMNFRRGHFLLVGLPSSWPAEGCAGTSIGALPGLSSTREEFRAGLHPHSLCGSSLRDHSLRAPLPSLLCCIRGPLRVWNAPQDYNSFLHCSCVSASRYISPIPILSLTSCQTCLLLRSFVSFPSLLYIAQLFSFPPSFGPRATQRKGHIQPGLGFYGRSYDHDD